MRHSSDDEGSAAYAAAAAVLDDDDDDDGDGGDSVDGPGSSGSSAVREMMRQEQQERERIAKAMDVRARPLSPLPACLPAPMQHCAHECTCPTTTGVPSGRPVLTGARSCVLGGGMALPRGRAHITHRGVPACRRSGAGGLHLPADVRGDARPGDRCAGSLVRALRHDRLAGEPHDIPPCEPPFLWLCITSGRLDAG